VTGLNPQSGTEQIWRNAANDEDGEVPVNNGQNGRHYAGNAGPVKILVLRCFRWNRTDLRRKIAKNTRLIHRDSAPHPPERERVMNGSVPSIAVLLIDRSPFPAQIRPDGHELSRSRRFPGVSETSMQQVIGLSIGHDGFNYLPPVLSIDSEILVQSEYGGVLVQL
jgi:hypothetical protein